MNADLGKGAQEHNMGRCARPNGQDDRMCLFEDVNMSLFQKLECEPRARVPAGSARNRPVRRRKLRDFCCSWAFYVHFTVICGLCRCPASST